MRERARERDINNGRVEARATAGEGGAAGYL